MKTKSLAQLAADINREFPDLLATAVPGAGYCNTDRKIGRLRWPGKGRRGTLLTVKRRLPRCCTGPQHKYSLGPYCTICGEHSSGIVFQHNAAETYRTNQDVVTWIADERKRRQS